MAVVRNQVDASKLNTTAPLPYQLRLDDFKSAMQDVYDFFYDVNTGLVAKRSGKTRRHVAPRNHVRNVV